MKKVYTSNSELIHVWANNDNSEVRKHANSVSCQYDVLFSYSTAIAQIYGNCVILNSHSYSVTTSKHQSEARQAIHGLKAISIDIPGYSHNNLILSQYDFDNRVIKHNERKASDLLLKASRSKKYSGLYMGMANNIYQSMIDYAELLNLTYNAGDITELQTLALENDKKNKALEKIQKAEKIKEQSEALEKWRAGEDVRNYFEVTALRIKNDEIQTSRGARIPLDHAVKAWPLLNRLSNADNAVDTSSHTIRLGLYTVNRIDKNDLIVGCHTIPMTEVKYIASQLNLKGA